MNCSTERLLAAVAFGTVSALTLGTSAQAQLFTSNGEAADSSNFTLDGFGQTMGSFDPSLGALDASSNGEITFGVDYSSLDVFGDGFITVAIPEAPNSTGGTATTGIFMTANSNSLGANAGQETSVSAFINGLNVGDGTANEDFVFKFDAFHSTGPGIDDGTGAITAAGTTNYQVAGINYGATSLQTRELNNTVTDQGVALAITADGGAGDDYAALVGGTFLRNRDLGFNGADVEENFSVTGLVNQWVSAQSGNDEGAFSSNEGDVGQTYVASLFPTADAEPSSIYTVPSVTAPAFISEYGADPAITDNGLPGNRWAEHAIYYVDGVMTYTIDGNIIQKRDFDTEQYVDAEDPTTSGTAVLGFWDRFGGSIASSPEGANFVIYDNISVETATAGDVPSFPDLSSFLAAGAGGSSGDLDNDDDVDIDDINLNGAVLQGATDADRADLINVGLFGALGTEGQVLNPNDLEYDTNFDLSITVADRVALVENFVEWDDGVNTGVGTKLGDLNLDGTVDGNDFGIFAGNFGLASGALYEDGDLNGDGAVDGNDFGIFAGNFGFSAISAGAAAVPEPASLALLALGGGLLTARRRRA